MAITVEGLEKDPQLPQGRMLHLRDYDVTYFSMDDFLRNTKYLKTVFANFAHQKIGWSVSYSNYLAAQGLNIDNLTMGAPLNEQTIAFVLADPDKARKIPSVAMVSKPDSLPGQYIAFTAQRAFYPEIQETTRIRKVVPVVYNILRAVDELERGGGIGKLIVGVTLLLHKDASFFMHRTGNYIAAYVNTQSDNLDQQDNSWYTEYPENPYLYSLARSTYALIRGDGPDMDEMGVVRGAYREPNLAIPVPLDHEGRILHEGSMRIWRIMHFKYKMGPLDGIVPIFRVAKHDLKAT